jgi:DNA-binding MarR family transcriptional regulator
MSKLERSPEEAVAMVERALTVVRRSQARRALHRQASGDDAPAAEAATFQVLDAIEAAAGRDMTVRAVADALGVDQPRASRLVARAVAAGWVERGADPDDGRRSVLTLTSRGRRVLAEVHRTRRQAVASALAGWSSDDRDTLARLLTAFVSSWERTARPARPAGGAGRAGPR